MNAIILCGGLATRLGELVKDTPKVMLEVKGRSVIDWQLDKLRQAGISQVVLAAGHLAEVLQASLGENHQGIKLIYAIEPERLGTGGAIKFAWNYLPKNNEPVIVLNGDILTKAPLLAMISQLRPDSDGIILGAKVPDASSYGTLEFNDDKKLLAFKEKEGINQPGYINGGVYLFTPKFYDYFPPQTKFSIEYDVFPQITDLDVFAYDGTWVDIGVPERLAWARENWPTT